MIQFDQVQRFPLKIILGILVALQLLVVLLGQHLELEQYVTVTVILLTFPIAYFGFHYLRIENQPVKTYKAIQIVASTQHTNKQIEKLQASEEYKQYLQRKRREQANGGLQNSQNNEQISQQGLQKNQQIARLLEELQQKETEIFDYE